MCTPHKTNLQNISQNRAWKSLYYFCNLHPASSAKCAHNMDISKLCMHYSSHMQRRQLLRMPQCNDNAYGLFATFMTYRAYIVLGKILLKSGIFLKNTSKVMVFLYFPMAQSTIINNTRASDCQRE